MPLYNVMERGMKLPRIGTIRKGAQVPVLDKDTKLPRKNGAGEIIMRPKEEKHFVFHIDPEQQEKVLTVLAQAYGSKEITQLNVFLALPDAYSNWSAWMEAYNFNQLVARSDERVVTYLFDVESNETLIREGVVIAHSKFPESVAGKLVNGIEIGKTLPYDPEMILAMPKSKDGKPIRFKAVGRLTVVIKELRRLVTFTVITGGYWYDIPAISTTIDILDSIAQTTGRGANTIPLILRRTERERKYTDESGAKKTKMSYDIDLEIRGDITAGLLETYEESPFALKLESVKRQVFPELPSTIEQQDEEFGDPIAEDPIQGNVIEEVPVGKNQPAMVLSTEADEAIDPLEARAVEFAAKKWNITQAQAAKQIAASNQFYAGMSKNTFKQLVIEGNKK